MISPSHPSRGPEWPLPTEAALEHSARLIESIRDEIDAAGPIPFDRFMELALYAPGLGYYVAGGHKLGAAGDFVTAPEISPLFAACLTQPCRQVLDLVGGGDILELGAGSGAMAADLLGRFETLGALPGRYLILELSPDLRERQCQTLAERVPGLLDRVSWLDRLPESHAGVILANEVIDAMPVSRFRVESDGLYEEHVAWEEGGLVPVWLPLRTRRLGEAVAALQAEGLAVEPGYESELNLRLAPWIATLGERLNRGALWLIDYGYPRAEFYRADRGMGTLMCHYRHRAHPNPYILVGLQDITSHVDFSAAAEAGLEAGLELAGFTTQANFLCGCGIDGLLAELDPMADLKTYWRAAQEIKHLLLPGAMGEIFKVMALSRNIGEPILGFQLRDLRDRL